MPREREEGEGEEQRDGWLGGGSGQNLLKDFLMSYTLSLTFVTFSSLHLASTSITAGYSH